MAVDQPTQRAQEAIAESVRLAGDRGNQVVEPEHLLLALLDAREGVVEPLLQRAGADLPALRAATVEAIDRRARVSGATAGAQPSNAFRAVLRRAGQEAERLGD
jgi:ATP-dependent Clp protease ATP-binding subunit ClpB